MKCIELSFQFGIEHLHFQERVTPTPSSHQVLVRMQATSLNYRDLLMVTGKYNPRQRFPLIPCSDGCGEVISVGESVVDWKVGDEVLPIFAQGWQSGDPDLDSLRTTLGGPLDGCLTEHSVWNASGLVAKPKHLSATSASTLACAGLTAWNALQFPKLQPNSNVVVLGTGGVSLFALQFAKTLGHKVILTSSSDDKLDRAKALGADEVINYSKRSNWERDVRKYTNGKGADLVVEVGGAGTLPKSMMCVRPGGSIALIGVLAGGESNLSLYPILMQGIRLQGVIVGSRSDFIEMNQFIETHKIQPIVDKCFDWKDTQSAFQTLQSATHFGKIAIEITN